MMTTYPVIPGRAKGASPMRGFRNDAKDFCLIAIKHTPEFSPGVWMWRSEAGMKRLAGSSRFLVLLVVVDFGELGIDHVFLLAFGRTGAAGAAGRLLSGLLVHGLAELH